MDKTHGRLGQSGATMMTATRKRCVVAAGVTGLVLLSSLSLPAAAQAAEESASVAPTQGLLESNTRSLEKGVAQEVEFKVKVNNQAPYEPNGATFTMTDVTFPLINEGEGAFDEYWGEYSYTNPGRYAPLVEGAFDAKYTLADGSVRDTHQVQGYPIDRGMVDTKMEPGHPSWFGYETVATEGGVGQFLDPSQYDGFSTRLFQNSELEVSYTLQYGGEDLESFDTQLCTSDHAPYFPEGYGGGLPGHGATPIPAAQMPEVTPGWNSVALPNRGCVTLQIPVEDAENVAPTTIVDTVAPTVKRNANPEGANSVRLPKVEGVDYTRKKRGSIVTIRAVAAEGYVLAEGAQDVWVFDVSPGGPEDPIQLKTTSPEDPQLIKRKGQRSLVDLPVVEGVKYTKGAAGPILTVTAKPLPGYEIAEGSQLSWEFDLTADLIEATTVAPELVPNANPKRKGSVQLPAVEGVRYTKVREGTIVTVTAKAKAKYVLADGSVTSWTFDIAPAK